MVLEQRYNLWPSFGSVSQQGLPEGFGEAEGPEEEEVVPAAPVHQPAQQPARGPAVVPTPPGSQPAPQPVQGEGEMEEEDIGEGGSLRGWVVLFGG